LLLLAIRDGGDVTRADLHPSDLRRAGEEVAAPAVTRELRALVGDLEVEVLPVARERGPRRRLLAPGEEFDAGAAVLVVHPDPAATRGASVRQLAALHDDVVAVGAPRGGHGTHVQVGEDGARVAPVGVHHPQVVLSPPVADEGDELSVGRDARVRIDGDPARLRQGDRLTAAGRHSIDVAEQIEDEPLAIGRDVDRHPRPFGGGEVDLAGRAARLRDVPRRRLLRERGRGGEGRHEGERGVAGERSHGAVPVRCQKPKTIPPVFPMRNATRAHSPGPAHGNPRDTSVNLRVLLSEILTRRFTEGTRGFTEENPSRALAADRASAPDAMVFRVSTLGRGHPADATTQEFVTCRSPREHASDDGDGRGAIWGTRAVTGCPPRGSVRHPRTVAP
jgi:hypothetical protein